MKDGKTFSGWTASSVRKAGWAPMAAFGFFLITAEVFDGYRLYPPIDIPTHLFSGMAMSYFLFEAFENTEEFIGAIPRPIQYLLAFSCLAVVAVFWEFYEFMSDQLLGTTLQHGNADTISDLFFGMLGGALFLTAHKAASVFFRIGKHTRKRPF